MKPLVIHAHAKAEWSEAADYYEACAAGLGRAFVVQVSEALDQIALIKCEPEQLISRIFACCPPQNWQV